MRELKRDTSLGNLGTGTVGSCVIFQDPKCEAFPHIYHRGSSGALPFRPRQTPVKEEVLDSGKGDPGHIRTGRVDEDIVLVLNHCRWHAEEEGAAGLGPGSPQIGQLRRRREASPV